MFAVSSPAAAAVYVKLAWLFSVIASALSKVPVVAVAVTLSSGMESSNSLTVVPSV